MSEDILNVGTQPFTVVVAVACTHDPDIAVEAQNLLEAYTCKVDAMDVHEAEIRAYALTRILCEQSETCWAFMAVVAVLDGHHETLEGGCGELYYNEDLDIDDEDNEVHGVLDCEDDHLDPEPGTSWDRDDE
jgi:hypothetical protein